MGAGGRDSPKYGELAMSQKTRVNVEEFLKNHRHLCGTLDFEKAMTEAGISHVDLDAHEDDLHAQLESMIPQSPYE